MRKVYLLFKLFNNVAVRVLLHLVIKLDMLVNWFKIA